VARSGASPSAQKATFAELLSFGYFEAGAVSCTLSLGISLIIVYLYLKNPSSIHAEQVLLKDPLWAAPVLWRSEFRNLLALCLRKP
jgi:hypothetical protein